MSTFEDISEWELFVRPLVAIGLGSLIGLERERVSMTKARGGAGFRTHVLVAVVRVSLMLRNWSEPSALSCGCTCSLLQPNDNQFSNRNCHNLSV